MKHSGFIVILLGLLEYTLSTSILGVSQSETLDKNEASHVKWNICPHGWIHATREREEFEQTEPSEECLFFSTEALSWFEAQRTCRDSNSFLVGLDTFISVGDKSFLDILEEKYAFSVWTGLHEEEERLLWDDPENGEVRNLARSDGSPSESRGGWSWNSSSFFNKNSTCGLLQLNSELSLRHNRNRRQLDLLKLNVGSDVTSGSEQDITLNRKKREKQLESVTNIFYDQDIGKQEEKAAGNSSTQKTEEARISSWKPDNTTVDPVSSDDDEFQNEFKKLSTKVQPEITTTQSSIPSSTANGISNVQTTPFTFIQTSKSQFDSVFSSVENSTSSSGFTELSWIKHDETTIAIESDLKSKIDEIEDAFDTFSKNSSTFIDKGQNVLTKESKPSLLPAVVNEHVPTEVKSFGDGIENVSLTSDFNLFMDHSNTLTKVDVTTIRVPVSSKSDGLPVSISPAEQHSLQTLAVLPKTVTDSSGFVATRQQVQVGQLGVKKEGTYDTTTENVTSSVEVATSSTDNTGNVTPPIEVTASSTDNTENVTPPVEGTANSTDNTESVTPPAELTANSRGDTEVTSFTEYSVSDTATATTPLNKGKITEQSTDHVSSYSDFAQQGPTVNQSKDYQLVTVSQTTQVEMKIQPRPENANEDIPLSPLPPTFTTEKQGNEKSFKIDIKADTEETPGSTTFGNPTVTQDGMNTIQAARSHLFHTGRKAKMSLQNCQQKNRFVCASKSIGGLRAVGHCERGWLGHSLLPYCYKPVGTPSTYSVAWRQCLLEGAAIISVENTFYENITELLIWTMRQLHGFPSGSVWVNRTVTSNKQLDRMCDAIRDGKLEQQPCAKRLPFICQKSSKTVGGITVEGDRSPGHLMKEEDIVVENMTSATPKPLWCPVQTTSHDDLVIWYKDGLPIPPESGNQNTWTSTISRSPGILHLTTDILRRLGYSKRFRQPAMLQGFYWCKVWRPHPLTSLSSYKIFVRFTDVITLQGFVKSTGMSSETETFFNKMRDVNSLPGIISRDLERINEEALRDVKDRQPYLQDIMSTVTHVNASTSETEILTYLCLSFNNLPLPVKGLLVEEYLKSVHLQLLASLEYLQRWNVTLSLDKALRFTVTEMCPGAKLLDKSTGYEGTFPITPVNHRAMSKEFCDGDFVGYAICSGNLRTGSSWGHREIDHSCNSTDQTPGDMTRGKPEPSKILDRVHVDEKSSSLPQKPKPDLLVLDEVHIEPENVADVTNRLERILTSTDQLTEVDIEAVAGVISRITVVPVLPVDVGKNLLQIVSRVLDSPLEVLRRAQEQSNATTRILRDLDHFAGKMDFAQKPHVRYVTPNIAMELWNLGKTRETVIGFGATTALNDTSLLSESRILTIKNRTWAGLHLANFDVAIELPDQVVMDPSTETLGMRLSMTIFRKPGLFLSSEHVEASVPPSTRVNSAIISATVDGRKIENLEQKVKLVFKPEKMSDTGVTSCVFWDFGKSAAGGWSSYGCTFNGTIRGRHICLCDHLTNFAVLLDFYGDSRSLGEKDNNALSMITIVGVSLSMLSLTTTIFTFIIFKKLRKGRAQQTLFNLSVALLCSQAVLLIGLKQTTHYGVCLVVAVLLHYFILASFMWMMVEAVLQYLIFVKILGTYISRYTLKTMLSAWGAPVIPVVTVLCIDYRQYRGRRDYCWMELEAFYYAFALPVGVIMVFNLVLFSVIMSSLMRRPMEGLRNSKNKHPVAETSIKAAFTIFVLLGLTWIFGYLAIEDARLPFQYLFTTLNSLQGFFIFVLLVARRRQVREQWKLLCCRLMSPINRKEKVSATHSSSFSSSFSEGSLPTSTKSFTTRSYMRSEKSSQIS